PYLHQSVLNFADIELLSSHTASAIMDLGPELTNRLLKLPWYSLSFRETVEQLSSKTYTSSRIRRGLLHLVLGIYETDFKEHYSQCPAPYVKILGLRTSASPLLKAIKNNTSIPIITKPASAKKLITRKSQWYHKIDLKADLLYQSLLYQKTGKKLPGPMQLSPVIIKE
ncbi:MAG: nucleotidyltransferase family protein, partial [Lachnospiraceae bacterium]|nr:nucleotidyltransferase family protein [Lachnospiraceae bacterium]